MLPPRISKAVRNENEFPYIIQLAVVADKLEAELGRRIVQFHKLRHIEPRHGRRMFQQGKVFYRWCFFDLSTAHAFVEQFGGEFYKPRLNPD